jgi:hypothetical protein
VTKSTPVMKVGGAVVIGGSGVGMKGHAGETTRPRRTHRRQGRYAGSRSTVRRTLGTLNGR